MDPNVSPCADGSVPAAIPDNESERLAQLQSFCILDTAKDERFDRITRLTAELLDVPIVLLSLVDAAREWFKSTSGTAITEIKREHGFCAHAILLDGPEVMVVPDTLDDPRFASHPIVLDEPKLRFYAGAPLITKDGYKLGMLCVHDNKPRPDFGARERSILSQLAGIAMDEIGFHRVESERELLIGELSHRVKNVFSIVQSVASVSSRGHPAAQPYVEGLASRITALASAHDQLVRHDWKGASLRGVVQSVIAGCQDVSSGRISVQMPAAKINPAFAQTLALVVHELLTNALKHGALKVPSGHVSFTGTETMLEGKSGISFEWRETGGPSPNALRPSGFGSRMLEMAVRQNGGTLTYDWQPGGLVCHFVMLATGYLPRT